MLYHLERIGRIAAAWAVAIFFAIAAWVVWSARSVPLHVNGVLTRAEGVESKMNATATNLDKATAAWAASAKGQADAVEDLTKDAHGTLSEVNQLADGLHGSADALHGELDSLHKTTDQATALATALTSDASTMNQTIAAAQPVLAALARDADSANKTVIDFDALVGSPDLSQALSHVNGMTASGDGILADAKKVADKETADWLKPHPWWQAPIAKGGQLIDIGAAIARHAP